MLESIYWPSTTHHILTYRTETYLFSRIAKTCLHVPINNPIELEIFIIVSKWIDELFSHLGKQYAKALFSLDKQTSKKIGCYTYLYMVGAAIVPKVIISTQLLELQARNHCGVKVYQTQLARIMTTLRTIYENCRQCYEQFIPYPTFRRPM